MNGVNGNNDFSNNTPNTSENKTQGRSKKKRDGYLDVIREKPIRVTVKVLVPVKEYPKFNFIGKLLGPKGNSLKRLQEQTTTKMAVLGRGSMRNRSKEEELRHSGDSKYQHLNEDLHVEISAFAGPAEAYANIAYALTEIRPYLFPDDNDSIRKDQIREMECLSETSDGTQDTGHDTQPTATTNGTATTQMPVFITEDTRPMEELPECYPPPMSRVLPPRPPSPLPPPIGCLPLRRKRLPVKMENPAKRRVLSILDRAKMALDRSYGIHSRPPCEEYHVIPEDYTCDTYSTEPYERLRHHFWDRRDILGPGGDRHHRRYDPYTRQALS